MPNRRTHFGVMNAMKKSRTRYLDPKYDSLAEQDYAGHLEFLKRGGEISHYWHHPNELRLCKGVIYRPDFKVISRDGVFEYHEVKGTTRTKTKRKPRPNMTAAGRIKLKCVAHAYRGHARFYIAFKVRGRWKLERVVV